LCLTARLSVWNNSALTGEIFIKFDIREFFENLSEKFRLHSNMASMKDVLHEDQYTFISIPSSVLL
jgi:hypothetical protein